MKKLKYLLSLSFAILLFVGCEDLVESPQPNYVAFAKPVPGVTLHTKGVDVGGSNSYTMTIFTGNVTNVDRTFPISVLPSSTAPSGSYTLSTNSVTVPAGSNKGEFAINYTDTGSLLCFNRVDIGFDKSNVADGQSFGADTSFTFFENPSTSCATNVTATLTFTFDAYASEISWEITDVLGGRVVAGGGYSDGQATAVETITLCANRCYNLVVRDSWGDGIISGPGRGYVLRVGTVTKVNRGGGRFTSRTNAFDTK